MRQREALETSHPLATGLLNIRDVNQRCDPLLAIGTTSVVTGGAAATDGEGISSTILVVVPRVMFRSLP